MKTKAPKNENNRAIRRRDGLCGPQHDQSGAERRARGTGKLPAQLDWSDR